MGRARQRGTRDERVAQAQARQAAERERRRAEAEAAWDAMTQEERLDFIRERAERERRHRDVMRLLGMAAMVGQVEV